MGKKDIKQDNVSYRELISEIRALREESRQQLLEIKECLNSKVPVEDFVIIRERTNKLWDERNKFIGWAIGAGIAGGGVVSILNGLLNVFTGG